MANVIIIIIIAVIILFALRGTVKHFKGESSCCGGGPSTVKARKKVLENDKIGEKIIKIEGMHCDHCKQSVTSALNKIEGAAAKVDLKRNQAVVSFDRPLDDEKLKEAVEKAGFKVVSIQ